MNLTLDELSYILDKNRNAPLSEKDIRNLKKCLIKMNKRNSQENTNMLSYKMMNIPFDI